MRLRPSETVCARTNVGWMIARHLNDNNRRLCHINIPNISHVHTKDIEIMPGKGKARK
jgi:hypothetical protein